ncbi:unnamed protein product [Sphenostylis stenocarpa]|uniref:Membrane protein of ER body-like protein n=1 Tax=Sphenostylis stenocarpa TaxID=92480 RepID=A0AA86SSN1_9FABA|nr:unnamed protein product [Sphenostylis stenocarpa]
MSTSIDVGAATVVGVDRLILFGLYILIQNLTSTYQLHVSLCDFFISFGTIQCSHAEKKKAEEPNLHVSVMGCWLFLGLVSDEVAALNDLGKFDYMDHLEGPNRNIKGTPQHEAPELEQSKKQMDQNEGKVDYMDHPEGPDQKFKGAPQPEAPEPDQSQKQMNQSEGDVGNMDHPEGPDKKFKGEPQRETPELDQSKKENNELEGVVRDMDHPQSPKQKFEGPPTPKYDPSKKQKNPMEGEDEYIDHPEGPDPKLKGVPPHSESDQSKKQMNQSDSEDILKNAPQYEATEPDQSKKQINQPEGEVDFVNSPEDPDQKFKDTPQPETPNIDESEKPINQSEAKSNPKPAIKSADDKGKQGLQTTDKEVPPELGAQKVATEAEDKGDEIAPKKKHFWSNKPAIGDAPKASIPKEPKTDPSKESDLTAAPQATVAKQPEMDIPEHIEVKVDEADTEPAEEVVPTETTPLLIHLLVSILSTFQLEELKSEQVDWYTKLLGQKKNFILHAFIAILSFLIFGLVPPVVYGFSFGESGDKDFKLAAVAAASLLCITMLSIAKAYIKRPNSYLTYFKTVLYYVSTGAVASLLSYIAGDLVKKLIEKLGWFESASSFSLQIPGIGVQQPGWRSY